MTHEDFSQPREYQEEVDALFGLLIERPASSLSLVTQFKAWSIEDVIAHLHLSDQIAEISLLEPDRLEQVFTDMGRRGGERRTLRESTYAQLDGLRGVALLEAWHRTARRLASEFEGVDPRRRLAWVGPDMSARSSISARLMETWAHGQAVYDRLGVVRVDTDRIRNVAVLGVNTFAWSFRSRGLDVPETAPRVRLLAPSGVWWEWNEVVDSDLIEGSSTEFCQVVTQTRALGDTSLRVEGSTAEAWMAIAQCFAGPPEDPPAPGTRFVALPSRGGENA